MRFAYVGWVGFGNLGDDAIAEALLGQLRPDEVVYAAHTLKDLRHALGRGGPPTGTCCSAVGPRSGGATGARCSTSRASPRPGDGPGS